MLKVGSLFSGIGGIELGLERTGGFKTIWQSEIDPYASAVLKRYWPTIPNLGDCQKIDWNVVERPDLICGGFPCQDISIAGKGAGIKEGTRSGLWLEFAKALRILRPEYALIENVSALTFRGLHLVLADLAQIGYDAEWFTLRASDVGAPHKRERIFVLAHAPGRRQGEKRQVCSRGDSFERKGSTVSNPASQRLYFKKNKQKLEGKERDKFLIREPGTDGHLSDPKFGGPSEQRQFIKSIRSKANRAWKTNRVDDGGWWAVEPGLGRVADGVSHRVDRLKGLGNAVVPQVAQVIGEAILESRAGNPPPEKKAVHPAEQQGEQESPDK